MGPFCNGRKGGCNQGWGGGWGGGEGCLYSFIREKVPWPCQSAFMRRVDAFKSFAMYVAFYLCHDSESGS